MDLFCEYVIIVPIYFSCLSAMCIKKKKSARKGLFLGQAVVSKKNIFLFTKYYEKSDITTSRDKWGWGGLKATPPPGFSCCKRPGSLRVMNSHFVFSK